MGRTPDDRPQHATPRRLVARVLVALALAAAEAALGTWWAALLLARSGNGGVLGNLGAALGGEPVGGGGAATGSLGSALGLGTGSGGSLGSALGLGAGAAGSPRTGAPVPLGGLLGDGGSLLGGGGSAHLAHQLHGDAGLALAAAVVLAVAAVAVAPRRQRTCLRLAGGVSAVAGLALLATWPVAAAVSAWSGGSVHRAAGAVLRAGAPVRVALAVALGSALVAGALAVAAGRRARRRRLLAGIAPPAA